MGNWEKSEQYRKYLVLLQFKEYSLYTVWGTNLEHDDQDMFLINQSKIVAFFNLEQIRYEMTKFTDSFFDKRNFENWLKEEHFESAYSTIVAKSLLKFEPDSLDDGDLLLEILNTLNIFQDFFIQINDTKTLKIFTDKNVVELKDYIYQNCFWKKDKVDNNNLPRHINYKRLKGLLFTLYNSFSANILLIK